MCGWHDCVEMTYWCVPCHDRRVDGVMNVEIGGCEALSANFFVDGRAFVFLCGHRALDQSVRTTLSVCVQGASSMHAFIRFRDGGPVLPNT